MKKIALVALAITGVLTACNGNKVDYTATGTWDGSTINRNNDDYVLLQRLLLTENKGIITGTWYVKGAEETTYTKVGSISGSRNGNAGILTATFNVPGVSGTMVYSGTFSGNTFKGTYTANEGGAGPFTFTRK